MVAKQTLEIFHHNVATCDHVFSTSFNIGNVYVRISYMRTKLRVFRSRSKDNLCRAPCCRVLEFLFSGDADCDGEKVHNFLRSIYLCYLHITLLVRC